MICPECGSAIIIAKPNEVKIKEEGKYIKTYRHHCNRCFSILEIQVEIIKAGVPELKEKWRSWLKEGRG